MTGYHEKRDCFDCTEFLRNSRIRPRFGGVVGATAEPRLCVTRWNTRVETQLNYKNENKNPECFMFARRRAVLFGLFVVNTRPHTPASTAEWRLVTTHGFVNSFEENRWKFLTWMNLLKKKTLNLFYMFVKWVENMQYRVFVTVMMCHRWRVCVPAWYNYDTGWMNALGPQWIQRFRLKTLEKLVDK